MPSTAAQRGGHGCTICADPNVEAIDAAIKSGAMSRSRIAKQFNVSESAVQRHKDKGHVTVSVERLDAETPEIAPASSLDVPAEMLQQFKRTLEAVKLARKQGNLNSIADANREHRQTLEGISKWNIEQQKVAALARPVETVNVAKHAQWLHIRTILFDYLSQPHMAAVRLGIAGELEAWEAMTPEQHAAWYERRKSGQVHWTTPPIKERHMRNQPLTVTELRAAFRDIQARDQLNGTLRLTLPKWTPTPTDTPIPSKPSDDTKGGNQ